MLGNRIIYDAFSPDARRLYWQQGQRGPVPATASTRGGATVPEALRGGLARSYQSPSPFERAAETSRRPKYLDPGKEVTPIQLVLRPGHLRGAAWRGSGKRVLNLTRSSYAGQHRYSTSPGREDVGSMGGCCAVRCRKG